MALKYDGDAGLFKVGCRYYDPQLGAFTSRDTELEQKPYLYCEHDPVNAVDPSGHFRVWGFVVTYGMIGATVSGVVGGIFIGGPIGAGIGAGIGRYIGGRKDGETKKVAAKAGIVTGVGSVIGTTVLKPVASKFKDIIMTPPPDDPMGLINRGLSNGWFR